jgi:hypothetical protein
MHPIPALVLDLETAPIDRALEYLPPITGDKQMWQDLAAPIVPDKRFTDPAKITADLTRKQAEKDALPAKIEADIAQRSAEIFDRCGLDPDLGRIVCGGYMLEGTDIEPVVSLCRTEQEEAVWLRDVWARVVLTTGAHRRLVSFNGLTFDLPFLMRRSLYLGVVYPLLNLDRYRTPHLDLMQRLSFNGAIKAHSLAFYAKRFSLPLEPDEITGADVPALVRDGSDEAWAKIARHCASDVLTTYLLASRLQLVDHDVRMDPRDSDMAMPF